MNEQISITWKQLVRGVILLLVMNVLFMLGLLFSAKIPRADVRESLLASADSMEVRQDFADGLMLDIAAAQEEDYPFWSIILNPCQLGDGRIERMPQNVREMVAGELEPDTHYDWLWHGYLTTLKPLLVKFDYLQIRQFNAILLIILILWGVWLTGRKAGRWAAISVVAFGLLYFLFVPQNLRYASAAITAFLGIVVLFSLSRYMENDGHDYWYFFVIGGIMAYLDLWALTLAALVVPMVPWILFKKRPRKPRQVVLFSLTWGAGYASIIISKWIWCALTFDKDVLINGVNILLSLYGMNTAL